MESGIAERIIDTLNHPAAQNPLRQQARKNIIERYSLAQGLAGYNRLLGLEPAVTHRPADKTSSADLHKNCTTSQSLRRHQQ